MNRFADFDAVFFPEPDAPAVDPIRLKMFQAVWEIPGRPMPGALVRLWSLTTEGRDSADLTRGELVDLLTALLPADMLTAWLELGITFDQLGDVLLYIVDCYSEDLAA